MDTFVFALNAVMPIVLTIALGYFLRRIGLFTDDFLTLGNRFAFRVLIPILLFVNVYSIEDLGEISLPFVGYCMLGIVAVFVLAIVSTCLFTKDGGERGALIQGMFRSNFAIIGMPLATSLFGAEGAAAASVLSAFTIPTFNALAVVTLSIFTPGEKKKVNWKKMLVGIVTNPLIVAVAAGIAALGVRALLSALGIGWRLTDVSFLYSALKSVAGCATPFSLIVLGGRFTFTSAGKRWKPILFGTLMRVVAVPLLTLSCAFLVPGLTGAHFAAYIAAFGTPVAVSSAVMAKEMGSDDELAGQLVVWSSIASVFTVFLTVVIFRMLNVF